MDDRCGWMQEGGTKQCVYLAGHPQQPHAFGDLLPWPPAIFKNDPDYQEGIQEVPTVSQRSKQKVEGKKKGLNASKQKVEGKKKGRRS